MKEYPNSVSKQCHEKILHQMNDSSVGFIKKKEKIGLCLFCYIKHKNKKYPVMITTFDMINHEYLLKNNQIEISINNQIKTIEFGNISYSNKEKDLAIFVIKENKNNNIQFLELDDYLYYKYPEAYYNKESIYIINYNEKNNISVSYGMVNNILKSEIIFLGNNNIINRFSPIFSLTTNKLIGFYHTNSNYYNKGIFLKFIIDEFIKYKHYLFNEINISVKVNKEEINKDIYFLGNCTNKLKELNE